MGLPESKKNYLSNYKWLRKTDWIHSLVVSGFEKSCRHILFIHCTQSRKTNSIFVLWYIVWSRATQRIIFGSHCSFERFWRKLSLMGGQFSNIVPVGSWVSVRGTEFQLSVRTIPKPVQMSLRGRRKSVNSTVLIASWQSSSPSRNKKYGRFPPQYMLHVDQVPIPFAHNMKRTLNPIGVASCRIVAPSTSGLDKFKRQGTRYSCGYARILLDPSRSSLA